MNSHLSHALLALIDRRKTSASRLGQACGIHQTTVSRACAGERLSVESLRALCTRQQHPRDGLALLLAHLRDEVERAGRSQTEVAITADTHDVADDILTLEEQARTDSHLAAILHDLAKMVIAIRDKERAQRITYPTTNPDESHLAAAEDQAPYGTPKNEP
jgi:hypothetical protein